MATPTNGQRPEGSIARLRREEREPVIIANDEGLIVFVNARFEEAFGWRADDVVGRPITVILPARMRDAHHIGFSRFLVTEQPTLIGRCAELPTLAKNGVEMAVQHRIVAERVEGRWVFGATLTPISSESEKAVPRA